MNSFENNNENGIRKEDILAKSRNEKKDEGEEYARMKGRKIGEVLGFYITGLILFVLSVAIGQISTAFAIMALFAAFSSGEDVIKYRLTKKARYMVSLVVLIAATLFAIFAFLDFALEWYNIHEFRKMIIWWY